MKLALNIKVLIPLVLTTCFGLFPDSATAADPEPKANQERFDVYIHKWLKMMPVSGRAVGTVDEQVTYDPVYGRGSVLIFLSSHCQPCQEQMESLKRIEQRYSKLFTDFIYIFVNDAPADALAFAKEYGISDSKLVHGSYEVLAAYKNPPLPTIYIGDRFGWIGSSFIELDAAKVERVDTYLKFMTAL